MWETLAFNLTPGVKTILTPSIKEALKPFALSTLLLLKLMPKVPSSANSKLCPSRRYFGTCSTRLKITFCKSPRLRDEEPESSALISLMDLRPFYYDMAYHFFVFVLCRGDPLHEMII